MIRTIDTHRVEIRQEDGCTQIYIDGAKIKRVRDISFHQSVDYLPTVTLDIYGAPMMNMDAFVEIRAAADEYLEYLNEKIQNSVGDVKYALMESRGIYKRLLGG